jgi:hypothetical protein
VFVGLNGYRLSFDQAMQTEEALTNKYHVAELYATVDRLSNPGAMPAAPQWRLHSTF